MKPFALLAFALSLAAAAMCQQTVHSIGLTVTGAPAEHEVTWQTSIGYTYAVEVSPDLYDWTDTGICVFGNGTTAAYGFTSTAEKLFYRIHRTEDPYNSGFLVLPEQNAQLELIEGVAFSFELNWDTMMRSS